VLVPLASLAQNDSTGLCTISVLGPSGTPTPLPLETGTAKSKSKLAGVGGMKSTTVIPGLQATARLAQNQQQAFVMSLLPYGPNASYESVRAAGQMAILYKLDVNKKSGVRELVNIDVGFGGIRKTKGVITDIRGIPLNFSHFDDHSVRIEPRSPLMPGEYAFVALNTRPDPYANQSQTQYFCFGVE
jgi:hypothetical protein